MHMRNMFKQYIPEHDSSDFIPEKLSGIVWYRMYGMIWYGTGWDCTVQFSAV